MGRVCEFCIGDDVWSGISKSIDSIRTGEFDVSSFPFCFEIRTDNGCSFGISCETTTGFVVGNEFSSDAVLMEINGGVGGRGGSINASLKTTRTFRFQFWLFFSFYFGFFKSKRKEKWTKSNQTEIENSYWFLKLSLDLVVELNLRESKRNRFRFSLSSSLSHFWC